VPHSSIREGGPLTAEAPEIEARSRIERARQRIGQHFYDRPEVRRTLAALILRRVLNRPPDRSPRPPESP
jgi:hypothetical protein